MKRVLLHCCCGPCTIHPLQVLRDEGFDVTGFFSNPNIHPYQEYAKRVSAFSEVARDMDLVVLETAGYGLQEFLSALWESPGSADPGVQPARCRVCYELRLKATAAAAARDGFDAFSTTLLVSPYQDHDLIHSIGESIAREKGLEFIYRDHRPGFRRAQSQARDMGLYMQKYCGCVFSEYERYGKPR